MAHQNFERLAPTNTDNPYRVSLLDMDGQTGFMRITPPVNIGGDLLDEINEGVETEFKHNVSTREATLVKCWNPDESGHLFQDMTEAAQLLLSRLGATLSDDLFKEI